MKSKLVLGRRPKCINDGCNNRGQFMGTYRKDGIVHPVTISGPQIKKE